MSNRFDFYTCFHLIRILNRSARNIQELLDYLKEVPDSSIYMHTFKFIRQHHYLLNEPPNDFAYWIMNIVGDEYLGEIFSAVDPIEFSSIQSIREKFIDILENYIKDKRAEIVNVQEGREFHFMDCVSINLYTGRSAEDLIQFLNCIRDISLSSIYFHMFEAPIRLKKKENDFSIWLKDINEVEVADRISSIHIYDTTLIDIKKQVIDIIEDALKGKK